MTTTCKPAQLTALSVKWLSGKNTRVMARGPCGCSYPSCRRHVKVRVQNLAFSQCARHEAKSEKSCMS